MPSPTLTDRQQTRPNIVNKSNRQKLEQIYRLILNRDNFGWDDDFFDLGGHSLKAMRLAAAIRKEFMIDLELQDLFDNPTLNQLFLFIAAQKPSTIPWIEIAPKQDDYPLSHSQRQIWTIDQLKSGSAEYNMPSAIRIYDNIDPEALQQAIIKLTERHEILRTSFLMRGGEPRQMVYDSVQVDIEGFESNYDDAVDRIRSDVKLPFDLNNPPLFRCKLFNVGDGSSILYLNVHHIIADEQSIGLFFEELLNLYKYICTNSGRDLIYQTRATAHSTRDGRNKSRPYQVKPELPFQYKDYSVWQQEFIDSKHFKKYERYWLGQFSDKPAPLNIPTDFPQSERVQSSGQTVRETIDSEMFSKISKYARDHNVTPFMYLLSAVNVLLYKYTAQSDIVIGLPTSLRIHPDLEDQIGFYVNVLAMRNKFDGWKTFPELLKQVKINATHAHTNRLYPFDMLIDKLGVDRYDDQNSLFNVMILFDEDSDESWWESDYQIEPIHIEEQTSKFDLVFQFKWSSGRLQASINFNDSLFTRETAERFLTHFIELNRSILADDSLSLDRLNYVPQSELDLVIAGFNNHFIELPGRNILEIIEGNVEKHPDKVAVSFNNSQLTYRELNSWANDIADALTSLSPIQPDDIIAVLMNRSDTAIASILGVLKTGAAFLPLDGDLPKKRIEYILEDSECKLLIKSAEIAVSDAVANAIDVESITRLDSPNPAKQISGSDLAYVIYTSGTTGRPKGVMVEHRNILTTVIAQGDRLGFCSDDTILQFSSLSFDASVMEIMMGLVFGAHQVPIQRDIVLDPNKFAEVIDKYRITTATLPPGYIASLPRGCLDSLRILASVAEAARPEDAEYYSRHLNYFNGYGPTETAVASAFYRYEVGSNVPVIPIGQPLANTKVYILDRNQQPVPIGMPGEMYIGGDNVARGYLKRQALTDERFVPDPFDSVGRLFKSGDIGKWSSDGNIQYVGRVDNMVKIRGFRVELGEIETTIEGHPNVIQSVVMARSSGIAKSLIAYMRVNRELSVEAIKAYLRERVPMYMIPDRFIVVDGFPLTDNGKIDTDALPNPREITIAKKVEPYSKTEEQLMTIWRKVLGTDAMDIYSNFFELGGSSLTAVQLIHTIQSELRITISTKELFSSPTVREIAKFVDSQTNAPFPPYEVEGDQGGVNSGEDGHSCPSHCDRNVATPVVTRIISSDDARKHLHITDQPLEELIISDNLPMLDAVALGYFNESLLSSMQMTEEQFLSKIEPKPILSDVIQTQLGTIGYIILPRFTAQIYQDKPKLLDEISQAWELADKFGAQAISLTGLIPSATSYGRDIVKHFGDDPINDMITTGHGTTIGTVMLTIQKMLRETKRSFQDETVAFLGLGSVGSILLLSLLEVFPHPKKILLCDLFNQQQYLEDLSERIRTECQFKGQIEILYSQPYPPEQFYESRFIIGATNVPDILEVDKLLPGTIVVDDSGPHCFNVGEAIQRMKDRSDLLMTEGGVLFTPENLNVTSYLPEQMLHVYRKNNIQPYEGFNPHHLTGCMLSCLLTLREDDIVATMGIPKAGDCVKNYNTLGNNGYVGGEFHIGSYFLDPGLVELFKTTSQSNE
ncbi:MAG: amino acid adenylation domain-containing protein [Candidatus Electryoneaceae bacterium]|nr:amino acid adenylation domain-containing protein [Candidatus Electryoneaceae bacterium]